MIYKLLNQIFGWDYVAWANIAGGGIARVHLASDGKVFYWRYKNQKILDVIKNPNEVIWLTCKPDKYFPHDAT